ncbi:uncharacterized protein LOC131928885 [Physella acuta]|uniref:uncharacterized protein LOC131928885 n=1 Tax=Physella acuta TaxID=109671 RepID=UPI0027DDB0C6|nr:uncharacterized protein LOC131928885 [Physella acuta]
MATLPANSRLLKPSLSAQDAMKAPSFSLKYGLLRKKPGLKNFGKWPRRFAILVNDCLYVYRDENAKAVKSVFYLQGYNQIKREPTKGKGQDWAFSIIPASNMESVKLKTFACVSDQERLEWMKAIRNQMYHANNITKPDTTYKDKLRSLSLTEEDADEYNELEQPIFNSGDPNHAKPDADIDTSSDSGSGGSIVTQRSMSLTIPSGYNDAGNIDDNSQGETYDVVDSQATNEVIRRKCPDVPLEYAPSKPPPRYSEVCEPEPPEYVNTQQLQLQETYDYPETFEAKISLEKLCTVEDKNPDRDEMIRRLQGKGEPGTYLIRQSRQGDEKVLAYLTSNMHVKEFKIRGKKPKYSLDSHAFFATIDELLENYTKTPLPSTDFILKRGFHQVS